MMKRVVSIYLQYVHVAQPVNVLVPRVSLPAVLNHLFIVLKNKKQRYSQSSDLWCDLAYQLIEICDSCILKSFC